MSPSEADSGTTETTDPEVAHQSEKGAGQGAAEIISVIVMSLTAILSAWSGFQAAKWGGNMSISFSQAGASRTESIRYSTIEGQQTSLDVGLFTQYVDAVGASDDELASFYLDRFPDRLRIATEAWLAMDPLENPDAPGTPFDLADYQLETATKSDELRKEAEQHASDARDHNQQGDNYVVLSVMFATVLFFAALSTKLRRERSQQLMLGIAVIGFAVGAIVIASMPIQL